MILKINRPLIVKILVGCLFIGGLYFYLASTSSGDSVEYHNRIEVDVPHSFKPEITGLIGDDKVTDESLDFRLNKYDIRRALIPAFECRDLKLETEVVLTVGDMMIPLTVYDSKHKIGYIWLDYHLFGEGLLDESLSNYTSQKEEEQKFLNEIEKGIELFLDNEEKFILDIFGEDPTKEIEKETEEDLPENGIPEFKEVSFEDTEAFMQYVKSRERRKERFSIIRSINATRNNWNFFKEAYTDKNMLYQFGQEINNGISKLHKYEEKREYLELTFIGFKKKIFLDKLNSKPYKTPIDDWIFSAAEMIEDPVRFFGLVQRIKYLGYPGYPNALSKAIDDQILEIVLESDSKAWWNHSNALLDLMQANKIPVINAKSEYEALLAKIITSYNYKKWPDLYKEINDLSNKYTISIEELKAIPGLSVSHGISIAPISILDDRVIYDMKESEYNDNLAQLRKKIKNSKDKAERQALQEELLSHSNYRSKHYNEIRDEAKAKSINVILSDVNEFLDWAFEVSEKWMKDNGA